MQVTINSKVNAQIIHGPDNVPAGTYYVDGISPYIKYHWDVIGATGAITPKSPNVAKGAVDEKMFITWNLNAAEHKIVVTEEPLFGYYSKTMGAPHYANNDINQFPEDEYIQDKIDEIVQTGPYGKNGRGILYLGAGTYYIEQIRLAAGVRIKGVGPATILKRTDLANKLPVLPDSPLNYSTMFSTYWNPPATSVRGYSFLARPDNMNSSPIEISDLTIDGSIQVNPANFAQYLPAIAHVNSWEHSHLINLETPHSIAGTGYYVMGPDDDSPGVLYNNNSYQSGGSGRLKVFIHNVQFKNCGGDAVSHTANVDLNMHDCTGTDIYRGTFTLTGGAAKARLENIVTGTSPAPVGILTKSIDLEGDHFGFGGSKKFRLWMDSCTFDKNVQLDYRCSNVLLTHTLVSNPPTSIIGYLGGDLVADSCTLSFSPVFNGHPNIILSPRHAKFSYTNFDFKGGLVPIQNLNNGCYNGLYFTNHSDPQYFTNSHIGFDNCKFWNLMPGLYSPSYPIYILHHQDAQANHNLASNLRLYFKGCSTDNMSPGTDLVALYTDNSCPVLPNPNVSFGSDVVNMNDTYDGGESEDQMKTHFGIRKIIPGPNNSNCDPTFTINHPNADIWFNPKASEMLAVYGNQPWPGPGKQLYINGTFDIDANLTLDNCHLWFTPDGSIQLNDDHDLLIQGGSTLEAACFWWHGIEVPNADNLISITGGSTIKNALHGVQVYDNAVIQVDDANFVDNGDQSILLMNMSANQYAGYIRKSNFTTQQSLLGGQFDRSVVGIRLRGVKEINIGDLNDPNSGNTFEGMHTGIRYGHWTNSNAIPISHIGIYNNSFTNIRSDGNDEYAKMVNCYTDADGAAIYCKADANPNSTCHLDVRNTINNINSPSFSACDKAIVSVGNSLEALHLNIYNNLLGIMCNSLYNRNFNIANNSINNVHMGIQLSGNQRNVFVTDNTITAFKTIFDANNNEPNITTYAPIGINYQMQTSWIGANIYQFVKDNAITINRIAGVGIINANVGKEFEENGNMVLFNTNSTAPTDNYNIQTLLGYFNVNNYKANYIRNTTIGPGGNAQVWQARPSISMLMNESRMCKLDCNRLRFTRFGFFVWGNNTTTETSITHNKCNANAIPWFFLDAATQGTFGDVGNATDPDNGNEFISTANPIDWRNSIPAINSIYKVFRLSSGTFPEKITTDLNLLDVPESGPSGLPWRYLVGLNLNGFEDPCTDDDEYDPEYIAEPDVDSNEYNSAMAVAQDSMAYINFPTVGSWIDQYKLYLELDTDSLLLNSSPELLYFYNTTATQTIGDIKYAAEKIALLYDSTTNVSNDSLRYAEAVAANTLISSANDWEMNEKTVNDVLLFMYNNPIDSIPLYMKEDMQFLASSCPFVEGTAVYRARTIYSLWEPNAIFDDRIICIQGQNKNQDNSNVNIDSLIESQISEANINAVGANLNISGKSKNIAKKVDVNAIEVYPNPASSVVIISYNSEVDGYFKLHNSFGEVVLATVLSKDITKTQLQIKDVANGLYHYEVEFPNVRKTIGKLTIIK